MRTIVYIIFFNILFISCAFADIVNPHIHRDSHRFDPQRPIVIHDRDSHTIKYKVYNNSDKMVIPTESGNQELLDNYNNRNNDYNIIIKNN